MDRFLASVERRAFRVAQLATRDTDDALDLVQEAMFNLVRRYAKRDEAEWPALFFTILQSRITDHYRRRKVRERFAGHLGRSDDEQEDPLASAPDPDGATPLEKLEEAEAIERLTAAIARLPLRQQQAFTLRTWEGLSVADTARAMKCSEGSVKTHLSRALGALAAALSPSEAEAGEHGT